MGKYIKRKAMSVIPPANGTISDSTNVIDEKTTAPSIDLTKRITGIPVDGVLLYEGDNLNIPEGYEEVNNPFEERFSELEKNKQDNLTAGQGIVITNNEISFTPIVPILIGTSLLCDGKSGSGLVTRTYITGHDGTGLLTSSHANITIPAGYHVEYKVITQIYTGDNNTVNFYLNNLAVGSTLTWSNSAFKATTSSKFFKLSDITLKGVCGYSNHVGIQLEYEVVGTSSTWGFDPVVLNAYLVKD